jgi:hypothetical protein
MPTGARHEVLDNMELIKGNVVLSNVTEWTAEHVELRPQRDPKIFRDVVIPPKTSVYLLRDGKIYDHYRQGDRE